MRRLPLAILALISYSPAFAEHGSPHLTVLPDQQTLPRNGRVIFANGNGVAVSPETLAAIEPILVSDDEAVPLRIVDRFDDMEGHARPFAEGEGYGNGLIVLAPVRPLVANTRYALEAARPDDRFARQIGAGWTTSAEADTKPPTWHRGPRLAVLDDGPIIDLHVTDSTPGLLLELKATPAEGDRADVIRLLGIVPEPEDDGFPGCVDLYRYDHARGVRGDAVHRLTGKLFDFSLTAIDGAGNRRRAPGKPVRGVWPDDAITLCNGVKASPAVIDRQPPRWAGRPTLERPEAGKPPRLHIIARIEDEALPTTIIATMTPIGAHGVPLRLATEVTSIERGIVDFSFADARSDAQRVKGLGQLYRVTLWAIDAAGHRRRAPGPPLEIRWTGELPLLSP